MRDHTMSAAVIAAMTLCPLMSAAEEPVVPADITEIVAEGAEPTVTAVADDNEKKAVIEFDKYEHDFGTFPASSPTVSCEFTYTNKGNAPLVIHQATASCGCTVPEYTKKAVQPGESGTIKVTYNGKGKFPGNFKKSITVRCNATVEIVRLYVKGNMEDTSSK